jgi:hypothetical protein
MCLPVHPYKVEREWKYKGLSCAVVQAREAGNRCGYVRVPPGHPAFQQDYDSVDVNVHGGLTFADLEPCTEHADGQGWWLGFDCAHFQDAMYDPNVTPESICDPETRKCLKIHREIVAKYYRSLGIEHYWTEAEVVAETEYLAEQLAEMSHVPGN